MPGRLPNFAESQSEPEQIFGECGQNIEQRKLTKRLGTANITTHKTINNVINPTTKLRFLREKTLVSEISIIIYIFKKKIEHKSLKTKPLYTIIHYESAEYNPLY